MKIFFDFDKLIPDSDRYSYWEYNRYPIVEQCSELGSDNSPTLSNVV